MSQQNHNPTGNKEDAVLEDLISQIKVKCSDCAFFCKVFDNGSLDFWCNNYFKFQKLKTSEIYISCARYKPHHKPDGDFFEI